MKRDAFASRRAGAGLFLAAWLGVLALLSATLQQPPVWDTSSGLFPAALTLAGNGFDLRDLLARPGWAHGGPNVHPFSSVTWVTAAVLRIFPEREVWLPLLHLLHFAMAAGTLLGVHRLARLLLPPALALAAPIVLLSWPLFLVQASYLYTEMPLALCTVWAVRCHASRRHVWAAVWSALACSVKEVGLVVPAALLVAVALERSSAAQRLRRLAALALPALVFVGLNLFVAVPVEDVSGLRPLGHAEHLRDIARKLALVPDLALLLIAFSVVLLVSLPEGLRTLREGPAQPEDVQDAASRVRSSGLLLAGAFAGFYLLVPFTRVEVYVLPRYYLQLLPFVLLLLLDAALRWGNVRIATALLASLALFFVANRRGDFLGWYPPVPGNEFSLAERSLEYRDLLAVQRLMLDAATRLPDGVTLVYGLPEHFLFSWPRMGYADSPRAERICVWLERGRRPADLAAYPPRFAILYNFAGYGGRLLQELQRQARRDPSRRVRATAFERGRYRTLLIQIEPALDHAHLQTRGQGQPSMESGA